KIKSNLNKNKLKKRKDNKKPKKTFNRPTILNVTSRKFKERHIIHTFINDKSTLETFKTKLDSELFQTEGYYGIIKNLMEYFSEFDTFDKQMFLSYIDHEHLSNL